MPSTQTPVSSASTAPRPKIRKLVVFTGRA